MSSASSISVHGAGTMPPPVASQAVHLQQETFAWRILEFGDKEGYDAGVDVFFDSVILPFSFIPIVYGQILSSAQPNLPRVSKVWVKNSSSPSPRPSRSLATGSAEVHTRLQHCYQIFLCRRATILPWTCLSPEGGDRETTRPAYRPLSCCSHRGKFLSR